MDLRPEQMQTQYFQGTEPEGDLRGHDDHQPRKRDLNISMSCLSGGIRRLLWKASSRIAAGIVQLMNMCSALLRFNICRRTFRKTTNEQFTVMRLSAVFCIRNVCYQPGNRLYTGAVYELRSQFAYVFFFFRTASNDAETFCSSFPGNCQG